MSLQAGAGRMPLNLPDGPTTTDGTSLAVRALVLDDGQTRLALVSLTVICLRREEADLVRAAVAEAAAVPASHILIACTHVHSGPWAVYSGEAPVRAELADCLARAAAEAARQSLPLRPAALGVATSHLPGVSRVRRVLRRDGSVITLRRAWPQFWGWATDPETVGPEEPLDDLLTVLRVEDASGTPLAAVAHFTTHPIPDLFGYAADLVERTHPGVPCLLLNGCQGTVDTPFEVPLCGRTQAGQLPILGDILGYRVLEQIARAETSPDVPLGMASQEVFLPAHPQVLRNAAARANTWPRLAAEGGFHTLLQALRLGDLALVAIPGEPQVSFGARLSEASPFPLTRTVGLANDECGYMLWPESRARGGYEADPEGYAVTDEGALQILLDTAREAVTQLQATGPPRTSRQVSPFPGANCLTAF